MSFHMSVGTPWESHECDLNITFMMDGSAYPDIPDVIAAGGNSVLRAFGRDEEITVVGLKRRVVDLKVGNVFRWKGQYFLVRGEDHGKYMVGFGTDYLFVERDFPEEVEVML